LKYKSWLPNKEYLERHLHIIDFTVPYPADYGGVIDLFWKLPALQKEGVRTHLHCFDYGRGQQKQLEKYCVEVNYYQRKKIAFSSLPFIVATRKNEGLLQRLLQDDHPILMEGIHSTYLLNDERFASRKKIVRLHNVEHEYYHHLYESATSFFTKLFFLRESRLLKKYEQSIASKAELFLSVTQKDADTYRTTLGCKNIQHLPLFLPDNWQVNGKEGNGNFCLYQGDLSVPANEKAALWLIEEVFAELEIPLTIAGKNPSSKLQSTVGKPQNISLVANPSTNEMDGLIANAQMNILPSFSSSGIKLKLLNALFHGRHCIVNNDTISGSGLDGLCHIANETIDMKVLIKELYHQSFSPNEIEKRNLLLESMFNNEFNARQMVKAIWPLQ
jgi:hypothetical protein